MILLDVNMPEMDGFELAEIVRSTNNTRHLREWDCDMVQGYLISQPLQERDFLRWLKEHEGGWQSPSGQKVRVIK